MSLIPLLGTVSMDHGKTLLLCAQPGRKPDSKPGLTTMLAAIAEGALTAILNRVKPINRVFIKPSRLQNDFNCVQILPSPFSVMWSKNIVFLTFTWIDPHKHNDACRIDR